MKGIIIRLELFKLNRLPNYLFLIISALYLFSFSFMNANIGFIERKLFTQTDLVSFINIEFCRSFLFFFPLWVFMSVGVEFDNKILQKNILSGLTRSAFWLGKLFQYAIGLTTIYIVYIFTVLFNLDYYKLDFSGSVIPIINSLVQFLLISVGYFTISFTILNIFKSSRWAILFYFFYILMEIIVEYFSRYILKTSIHEYFPIGILRCLYYDNSYEYIPLSKLGIAQSAKFVVLIAALTFLTRQLLIKRDLPKL